MSLAFSLYLSLYVNTCTNTLALCSINALSLYVMRLLRRYVYITHKLLNKVPTVCYFLYLWLIAFVTIYVFIFFLNKGPKRSPAQADETSLKIWNQVFDFVPLPPSNRSYKVTIYTQRECKLIYIQKNPLNIRFKPIWL